MDLQNYITYEKYRALDLGLDLRFELRDDLH